jgi:hypothetical protein
MEFFGPFLPIADAVLMIVIKRTFRKFPETFSYYAARSIRMNKHYRIDALYELFILNLKDLFPILERTSSLFPQ